MKLSGGAALLLVLAMISVVSVVVLHSWFVMGLHYDIAMQRELWQKNFYTTEALLHAGLGMVKKHYGVIVKTMAQQNKPYTIDMTQAFASVEHKNFGVTRASIIVCKKPNQKDQDFVIVNAVMHANQGSSCQIRCKAKKVVVKNETQLAISHFTLSPFVQ